MLRPYLGNIGHISVIIAFVAALVSTYAYWQSTREKTDAQWQKLARWAFFVHSTAIMLVCVALFSIIFNHYFEYHYAWDNSSLSLPLGYAISCFWQDQEGSFLLWMFWNVVLGLILIGIYRRKNTGLEAPMMTVFALVQTFLTSMILGVIIYGDFKLGSSPFLLLKESMPNLPVWKSNPNFIPTDGNGLNPLLQNYWMVIHPPTLFLGFAATLVPFAFCVAGLWKKQYTQWLKPALPWALVAVVILGTGIMMGGVWAYETLNFGGYWNWDPVENAVYVPWLILVAGLHTMLLARKNSSALKISIILIIAQFILILYSTFLTRSGILGNSSVHSFTDLGLSGQLLVYLFTFIIASVVLSIIRWKDLPTDEKELSTYSTEFWLFCGILTLCLAGFQVIFTTSIPVYNKIAEGLGFKLNMAPPTNQVGHYTPFQMWFFTIITVLTGIAQFYWWKRIQKKDFSKLLNPFIITLLISALIIFFGKVNNWKYIIVLTAAIFGITANTSILLDAMKGKLKVAGGAITHIGVALMLLGAMFSSAYEKIATQNVQTKFFREEKDNGENAQLWLNSPTQLDGFSLTYKGKFVDVRNVPGYIEKRFIKPIAGSDFKGIARADVMDGDKIFYKKGDTLEYESENTYYQVQYASKTDTFNLYPRFQINQKMGNVASPDIKKFWNRDIYAHVNYIVNDEDRKWSMPQIETASIKDTMILGEYVGILEDVQSVKEVEGLELSENDAAARASLRILQKNGETMMYPTFVIKDREVWSTPSTNDGLGLRIQLNKIEPQTGKFTFTINYSEPDFIVLKALEKPHINLLWIGTLMVMFGAAIAAVRRFRLANLA